MKKKILFVVMVLCSWSVYAQESNSEKLYKANLLYEKGKIDEAIIIAESCISDSATTTDQWQAYRLLSMAYLAQGDNLEARNTVEKMVELNPTYKPSKIKDPTELVKLIRSVKVIPKFTMGLAVTIGGNITSPHITKTFNGADYSKDYSSKSSWQFGLVTGYHMNEIISLHAGLKATSKKFEIDYQVDDWKINVKENLTYLDVPVFARFTSKQWNGISALADVGGYAGYLVTASNSFSRTNSVLNFEKREENLNAKQRMNNWEYGLFYGAGASYKIKNVHLVLDLRYYLSYANITNEDNRYADERLFYSYYFFDDNLRLNNLAISLSLIYNVNYKVIKAK
jgi:tetratricopeptide (TPR) repeat protein